MSVQETIEQKLADAVELLHIEVINESDNHNVPPGSESHFKVVLVSESFDGQALVVRHKTVNKILSDELANDIHALAIHTYTEPEWRTRHGEAPMSPPCLGGSNGGGNGGSNESQ